MSDELQHKEDADHKRDASEDGHEESSEIALRKSVEEKKTRRYKARAYFENVENWVAFLTFAVVCIYTAITFALWWVQIQANGINRDNLWASQRPWVGLEVHIVGPLEINKENMKVSLKIESTNDGHSPAQMVRLKLRIALIGGMYRDGSAAQNDICNTRHGDTGGVAIFPGHSVTGYARATITGDDVIAQLTGVPQERPLEMVVVGCAKYAFSTFNGTGETGITLKLNLNSNRPISAFRVA